MHLSLGKSSCISEKKSLMSLSFQEYFTLCMNENPSLFSICSVSRSNCEAKPINSKCISARHTFITKISSSETYPFPVEKIEMEKIQPLKIVENCLIQKYVGSSPPENPCQESIIIIFPRQWFELYFSMDACGKFSFMEET